MEHILRKKFEEWISSPPYERETERKPTDPNVTVWPGHYQDYNVQLAWEAYQEASITLALKKDLDTLLGYDFADEYEDFSEDSCSLDDCPDEVEWDDYVKEQARKNTDHIHGSIVRIQDWLETLE